MLGYTFYNVLLNSITLIEYLTSHYKTFRKTHYRKIKLLEYIPKTVELLEYTVRPDLTFHILCQRGVHAPIDYPSRLLFNTAMANTNCCNPNTMNPADRRRGCGKGKVKEEAPPARRSARTNPSAAVGAVILVS